MAAESRRERQAREEKRSREGSSAWETLKDADGETVVALAPLASGLAQAQREAPWPSLPARGKGTDCLGLCISEFKQTSGLPVACQGCWRAC